MRRLLPFILLLAAASSMALAEARFPAPEFTTGYKLPATQKSAPASPVHQWIDMAVFAAALGVGVWLIYYKRHRRSVFFLTLFSLLYFGFYRKGCICAVGSIQNVALGISDPHYVLPWGAALVFFLPLVLTLFYGRVFCAGVCPLGAIQDVVLVKPLQVPNWLEQGLGLFAYIYLGLAVMLAWVGSDFIICRYDPFVGFFRRSGPPDIMVIGVVLLALSMFVGRFYCRFICPLSVLFRLLSPLSWKKVTITPDQCVDCRLCETSCPFGAIRKPTPTSKPLPVSEGRRRLAAILVLVPVLAVAFAWLGRKTAPVFSRADFTVQLADRIYLEEAGKVEGRTDASKAYRDTGAPIEDLYQRARQIEGRVFKGAGFFGAWVGLVVGLRLAVNAVRRRRVGYTTDPAGCVACARCFLSCPVEQYQRGLISEMPVAADGSKPSEPPSKPQEQLVSA